MARGTPNQHLIYYNSPYFFKNWISTFYGWRQKKKRYGVYFKKHFDFLNQSQWYNKDQLIEIQHKKLFEFLNFAATKSNYYLNLFKEIDFIFHRKNITDELKSVPIIKKETVRKEINSIIPVNKNQSNLIWTNTSGTTGQSLHFPISEECFQREHAFRELHYSWGGINRNGRIAVCAGHPVTYYDRKKPPFWTYDYSNKWLLLSSSHLTENNLPHYLKEIEKFNPDLLKGYPSSIYILAIANKHFGFNIKPKAIYTASETLLDFQRTAIEESFGAKVFSWYGTAEMTGNIVECEKGNNHLKLEHSYVEILDRNDLPVNPGEEGRLICTAFGNYALPLIRYDIGDVVVLSDKTECECGRGGQLIEKVIGRTEDYILTPDGRFVGRLDHIFKDNYNVRNAQIIQNKIEEITIRIVKEDNYSQIEEKDIFKNAQIRLGSDIIIKFEYVDQINKTGNSKYKFIESNIDKKKLYGTVFN